MTAPEEQLEHLKLLDQGILLFNNRPRDGLSFLIENSVISSDPCDIATFLATTANLDKTALGEFIGSNHEQSLAVLNKYAEQFQYQSKEIDEALRSFLSHFVIPGESQMVYRILERFSEYYAQANPDSIDKDTAHVLSYAIIMLNVDSHSPHVKRKMTRVQFVKNLHLEVSSKVSDIALACIYDRIVAKEFRPETSPSELAYSRIARHPKYDKPSAVDLPLIKKGANFTKFSRKGVPQQRFVFLSSDGANLCWTEDELHATENRRSMPIAEIFGLSVGFHGSEVLRNAKIPAELESRCFSILAEKRTLDLQAPRSVDLGPWLQFFHSVLVARDARLRNHSLPPDRQQQEFLHAEWQELVIDWSSHWNCGARVGISMSSSENILPKEESLAHKVFSLATKFILDRGQRFETAISEKFVTTWLLGLPCSVRPKFWQLAVGNPIRINWDFVCSLRARSLVVGEDKESLNFHTSLNKELESEATLKLVDSVAEYMGIVDPDFSRKLSWASEGNFRSQLIGAARILVCAFHGVRPEIKFPEGITQLAVMAVAGFATEGESIIGFLNILHQHHFLDFFTLRWGYMRTRLDFFEKLFSEKFPLLVSHFELLHLNSQMFVIPWLLSGFARILPFRAAARLWDGFLLLGESHLCAAALAFLNIHEHNLMTLGFAGCIEILLGQSKEGAFDEDRFFACLKIQAVSPERLAGWLSTQKLAEEKQALYDLLLV